MSSKEQILVRIKNTIQQLFPDATIVLFGSRVANVEQEESDWDILILTKETVNQTTKLKLHGVIFPLSVEIGAFINVLSIKKENWQYNPAFYSLKNSIASNHLTL
jgi:uncharacterized protein